MPSFVRLFVCSVVVRLHLGYRRYIQLQAGTLWTAMYDGNMDGNIKKLIIQIQRTIDSRGKEFDDDSDYFGESEG